MKRILFLIIGLNLLSFCIDLKGTTGSLFAQESTGHEYVDHDGDGIDDEWDEDCQCYLNYEPVYGCEPCGTYEGPEGMGNVSIPANAIGSNNPEFEESGMVSLAYGALTLMEADLAVPDPTDLVWYKWAGYGLVAVAATGVIIYYNYNSDEVTVQPAVPQIPPIPLAGDLPWTSGTAPGPGWVWKGKGTPESGQGNWVNDNGQKLHPDLTHPDPKGPHWGLQQPDGTKWDIFPDGTVMPN